jgi:hypothetical protein
MKSEQAELSMRADAWRAYRIAFRNLSQKVRSVQFLRGQTNIDQAAVDAALLELEQASVVYKSCRDALAYRLLPPSRRGLLWQEPIDSSQLAEARVRRIAELRWEVRGKPEGTANEDWNHAEEIIRRTAAA